MDPEKLKVVDLRKELQQRGLDTKGNKAVLVKRLKEALDAEAGKDEPDIQQELTVKVESLKEPKPPKKAPLKETPTASVKTPVATLEKSIVEPVIKIEKETETSENTIKVELQTPLPIPIKIEEVNKTPVKSVKLEPQTPASLATAVKVQTSIDQQAENVDDQQVVEESVMMETETRGEKRKREDDDEDVESTEKKRREDSPVKSPDKPVDQSPSKPEVNSSPVVGPLKIPIKENEPEIDYEKPQLSWFDSDLHLNIDNKTFLSAKPLNDGCFGYIWAGARATHGIASGKICFEVKITEELKWDDMTERMREFIREKSAVKDKYKIDRRKDKNQSKLIEAKNDTEKQEEDKPKEGVTEDTQTESKDENEQNGDCSEAKEEPSNNDLKSETPNPSDEVLKDTEQAEESKDEVAQAASEVTKLKPIPTHYFRVGFSLPSTSLQLGEAPHSYAYESTARFVTNNDFQEYGSTFGIGDVVGAYLSIDKDNAIITFTVNGIVQPTAITVPRSELPEDLSLFPHVLCRNYAYELNFGANETPWFPQPEELKDYEFLQAVQDKVSGPKRPDQREECEVLLMIGLPGSGKTHWVKNYLEANLDKKYTIIGNHALFDRMTVDGQTLKSRFSGSWKILVDRLQKSLNVLTDRGSLRRRNYIIDQTNLFPNAQRRKLRSFDGFKRKAVIVVCEDEEYARRQKDQQNDFGKIVPESTMYDLKAQMEIPQTCEWLDEMIFTDLDEEEARKKVKSYNEEANKKGYFQRWQNNRRVPQRSYRPGDRRGGFSGSRFDRYPPGRGGFIRSPPYPGRRELRTTHPSHINPWRHHPRGPRLPDATRNRENRNSGFGGVRNQSALRNQSARNTGVWQNSAGGSNNWGSGYQGGWNSSMYQGFNSAWNDTNTANQQSAWKYGGNQSGYNNSARYGNQANYGNFQGYQASHQGYGAQSFYGSNQGGYGSQGNYGGQQGYGQQNWNYHGPYGQQQGWGNQKRK